MFQKYNSFTNTLSASDQVSAYIPGNFGTKEATNNYFLAPQPKGRQPGGSITAAGESKATSTTPLLASIAAKVGVNAAHGHTAAVASGHGHGAHATPWEGVNLWRTPFKGDADTVTRIKRTQGPLDRYVEGRVRRIQELQLFALRNKSTPTWILMPRDKLLLAVQGVLAAYVIFQVGNKVYQHLKAKDRLKLIKLLYKDNVD